MKSNMKYSLEDEIITANLNRGHWTAISARLLSVRFGQLANDKDTS